MRPRQAQGRDRDHVLTGHGEGLAAGGQDAQGGSGAQHVGDQLRCGGEQVLAVVDDEEHVRVAQVGEDQGARLGGGLIVEVERRQHRVGEQRRVLDVGQLDQPGASGTAGTEVGADPQREARLRQRRRARPGSPGVQRQACGVPPRSPCDARRRRWSRPEGSPSRGRVGPSAAAYHGPHPVFQANSVLDQGQHG